MDQVHYFTDNHALPSNRKEHSFRFFDHLFTFETDDGVFSKKGVDYGTEVLLRAAVEEDLHGDILDMGCGYGMITMVIGKLFPACHLTAVDVNSRAVELTGDNAVKNGLDVKTVISDGFAELTDSYDAVLTNPPIRAGKKVIYGMFADSYEHLRENGILLAVIRKQQGAESAKRYIAEIFGNCEVVLKDKGYWVLRAIKCK